MKKLILGILFLSMLLTGCVTCSDGICYDEDGNEMRSTEEYQEEQAIKKEEKKKEEEAEAKRRAELKEKMDKEKEKKETKPVAGQSDEQVLTPELIQIILEQNFEGTMKITFKDGQFYMLPIDQDVIDEIALTAEGLLSPDQGWNGMVDSFAELSKSMEEYPLHLLNPYNESNTLVTVVDGLVMYDAMNE